MIYQRFLDDDLERIQNELFLLRQISNDTSALPERITAEVLDGLSAYCEREDCASEYVIEAKNQCIRALARALIQYSYDIVDSKNRTSIANDRMLMNLTQLTNTLNKMIGTYCLNGAANSVIPSWVPLAVYAAACVCCNYRPMTKIDTCISKALVVSGEGILKSCQQLSSCENQNEVFSTFLTQLLSLASQYTSKDDWIAPQSLPKFVLRWIILKISFPSLGGDGLGHILALVFPLVDSCQQTTQLVGIEVLYHVIKNVTATELRWYSEVLLEVLGRAVTTRTSVVLDLALASLVSALEMLQIPSQSFDLYDQFFLRLINDTCTAIEHNIRLLLLRSLRQMVKAMSVPQSIHLVSYLQPLLEVALRTFDSTNTPLVSEALLLLQDVITSAWPRITHHTEDIFVGVLRSVAYCATLSTGPTGKKHLDGGRTSTLLSLGNRVLQLLHALEQNVEVGGQRSTKILDLLRKTQKEIRNNTLLHLFCSDALESLQAGNPQIVPSPRTKLFNEERIR
uniref:Uncharacterized protein AlNc14C7G928 n=1 Tax=Albugo laibachii Nc14 TaxID=890382 RepID=F0W1F9_9STRA|nr:conserved hypothetical protein [Albugo laibachii Nc14]|eukprot:CCA14888.1 conserved hypothetical protein [Albugo laibachii Nc14]